MLPMPLQATVRCAQEHCRRHLAIRSQVLEQPHMPSSWLQMDAEGAVAAVAAAPFLMVPSSLAVAGARGGTRLMELLSRASVLTLVL